MQNYNDMMKMWSQFKVPGMENMQMPQMPKMDQMFKMPQMPQMPKMGQVPNMDMSAVTNMGKRNMEACTSAAQCVTEGMQTAARRQSELARASVEKLLKTSKDMLSGGSPEINTAKQAEFAKAMIEQCMSNLREVSELYSKSSFEAFDVLNKRAAQNFEELSKLAKAA